ncbi:MAG: hypothetical protein NTX25_05745 [Proteobacteria bacterium]|nr:hypothetical protein [Pseudomonadota bacterium]
MGRSQTLLRKVTICFGAMGLFVLLGKSMKAALKSPVLTTFVEIDGVDYGPFDSIQGIEKFARDGFPLAGGASFETISLTREFVTHPSLYLWAKNQTSRKFGPKDIHLITENEEGYVVSRKVLQLCQPLSWSVESSNPSLGGFNESVDLAVQKVSAF